MAVAEFIAGLGLAEILLGKVLSKKGTKIDKKIKAVTLMQKALNNTEAHLTKTNHDYTPNEVLSNLWNDAFESMIPIDKDLAFLLNIKSKFWSNPNKWIENKSSMELIPTLNELDEKCGNILIELSRRK